MKLQDLPHLYPIAVIPQKKMVLQKKRRLPKHSHDFIHSVGTPTVFSYSFCWQGSPLVLSGCLFQQLRLKSFLEPVSIIESVADLAICCSKVSPGSSSGC